MEFHFSGNNRVINNRLMINPLKIVDKILEVEKIKIKPKNN